MKVIELGPYELIIWLFYIAIGALILYLYKSFNSHKTFPYLLPGFFLKVIGGFIFAMVYIFYYRGTGDTIEYFFGSKQLANYFWQKPSFYFQLMNSSSLEAQELLRRANDFIRFSLTEEEWFMIKVISPLNVLSLRTYLGITFFMSFIAFIGSYKMFQLMIDIMGDKYKGVIFVINFLVPSVLFWGSGLLKDTITLASFSFLVFFLYQILIKNKFKLVNIIFLVIFSFVIFKLKAYILICLLIWILITMFLVFINKSSNPIIKFLLFPYLIAVVFGFGFFGLQILLSQSDDYRSDNILKKIEGFQSYHSTLGGSVYSLGEIEYTEMGLLKKMPAAINVTLFRPYPWEANTFMVLINSLESVFLFFFILYVLFKFKFSFFSILKTNSFLIGGFIFILIFAFFIGISSYNFGALSRFKLPIVGLFFFILYYIYIRKKEKYVSGLK